MGTSSASGGCKNCKRVSEINNAPSVYVDFLSTDPNNVNIQGNELWLMISSNFDGHLSQHCATAAVNMLNDFIVNTILSAGNAPGKCYSLQFPSIKVEADCTCNDDDIFNGNGPAKAVITISTSQGGQMQTVPCNPGTPPTSGPPNVG
jgi:hypothetical protein